MVVVRLALVAVVLVVVEVAVEVRVLAVEQVFGGPVDQQDLLDGLQRRILALIAIRLEQIGLALGPSSGHIAVRVTPVDDRGRQLRGHARQLLEHLHRRGVQVDLARLVGQAEIEFVIALQIRAKDPEVAGLAHLLLLVVGAGLGACLVLVLFGGLGNPGDDVLQDSLGNALRLERGDLIGRHRGGDPHRTGEHHRQAGQHEHDPDRHNEHRPSRPPRVGLSRHPASHRISPCEVAAPVEALLPVVLPEVVVSLDDSSAAWHGIVKH